MQSNTNFHGFSTWTCRVCLQVAKGDLIPLSSEVEGTPIVKMIRSCSGVEILPNDSFPQNCCEHCVGALHIAYSIGIQCRETNEKLQRLRASETELDVGADSENAESVSKTPQSSSGHEDNFNVLPDDVEEAESFSESEESACEIPQNSSEHESSSTEQEEEMPQDAANAEVPRISTTCCACRTDFETTDGLNEHVRKVHEPERTDDNSKRPYQCEICFKRYFKKTSLNRHKRLGALGTGVLAVKDEEPVDHRCCGCRKDFVTLDDLKEHSIIAHDADKTNDDTRPFECEICFKRYSCKTSLGRHFRERLIDKRPRTVRKLALNQCCGCRLKFASKEQLMQHSRLIHEADRTAQSGDLKPFECNICFSRYTTQEAYKRHRSTTRIERMYHCQQCGKTFVKRIMLRVHERKFHNGVQKEVIGSYQCTRCGKTFMHRSSLINHENWHDSNKTFQCHICRKLFLNKGNLQTHLRLHSEPASEREPQFECPICRCRFKTPNYLEVHARVHTGEKPYQCTYCDKQFAHASGMKRHLLTHTGEKRFSCRFCQREFSNRPSMMIHEKTHSAERDVKCDVCEKEFVHVRYMRKHRKRHFS